MHFCFSGALSVKLEEIESRVYLYKELQLADSMSLSDDNEIVYDETKICSIQKYAIFLVASTSGVMFFEKKHRVTLVEGEEPIFVENEDTPSTPLSIATQSTDEVLRRLSKLFPRHVGK